MHMGFSHAQHSCFMTIKFMKPTVKSRNADKTKNALFKLNI